jgi:hypothetical protein|tara:strand:- start:57 stop:248 length:192 start_codon:yes stop_codon:yes gene_type:complete
LREEREERVEEKRRGKKRREEEKSTSTEELNKRTRRPDTPALSSFHVKRNKRNNRDKKLSTIN